MSDEAQVCMGPLVWFDIVDGGALLSCVSCDYIIVSGNVNDEAHRDTDLVHEGL